MSTAVPQSVGEKLDLSKYFRVFRRRIWWGIVPFVLLAIVFGVICPPSTAPPVSSVPAGAKSPISSLALGGVPEPVRPSSENRCSGTAT